MLPPLTLGEQPFIHFTSSPRPRKQPRELRSALTRMLFVTGMFKWLFHPQLISLKKCLGQSTEHTESQLVKNVAFLMYFMESLKGSLVHPKIKILS